MQIFTMKTSFVYILICVCFYTANAFSFSEKFKVCHKNDPQLDSCLAEAIEAGINTLGSTGLPALSIPSIDPLKIAKMTIGAGTSAVNLVQKYSDARMIGLSKLKVTDAHFDPEKKILTFTTTHPVLKQDAKYDINGKILVLPVFGKGDSHITFKDAELKHTITLEEETKNDKKYFKVKDYLATITIKGAKFDFKNLFNGDKRLSDNITKVVNDNWSTIFEDVKEGVEKSYSKVFQAVASAFLSKMPIDDMLPN